MFATDVNIKLFCEAQTIYVVQLEAGARLPQRALKAINRDRKIQELKERFDTTSGHYKLDNSFLSWIRMQ